MFLLKHNIQYNSGLSSIQFYLKVFVTRHTRGLKGVDLLALALSLQTCLDKHFGREKWSSSLRQKTLVPPDSKDINIDSNMYRPRFYLKDW